MNAKNTPPPPTKSRSIEHQAATLAQTLRKKRVALARARTSVSNIEGDIELLKKTAPKEALEIALRILGETA